MTEALYRVDLSGRRVLMTANEVADFRASQPAEPSLQAVRVAKGDIWRRATDEEADVIDAALQAQPLRLRNLFRDAAYLSSDDEMWPDLYAGFVKAFGPVRAAQILAPSA